MPAAKILLVHYDPRCLDSLSKMLTGHGFDVSVARDGAAAVIALVEHRPQLVLIEAMLPKISGFEVCADLKKTKNGKMTPVVLMSTVYKGHKYRQDAIHTYGADEYIELPQDDAQMVATLQRLLLVQGAPGVDARARP